MNPCELLRDHYITRETPVHIDSRITGLIAEMRSVGEAVMALAAIDVTFQRDGVTGFDAGHAGSNRLDNTCRLEARRKWSLRWIGSSPKIDIDKIQSYGCMPDTHLPNTGLSDLHIL